MIVPGAKVVKISGNARFSINFVKNRDMEEKIKYFVEVPFDVRKIEKLDIDAINAGIEQASKCVEYQYKTIYSVRDNCKMILSWLIGAMMALIGAMMATAASETPNMAVFITSAYELLFAFAIGVFILHKAMFKKTVFSPGDSPSHLFADNWMKALEDFEPVRTKYLKGWFLEELQFRIIQNKEEQMREVLVYRRALVMCLIALVSGAALITGLLLFGI